MNGRRPRSRCFASGRTPGYGAGRARGATGAERWDAGPRSDPARPPATVRLELDSRPESVTLVRATLSALADPLGLDDELLNDVKTAVSEACNNVALHAYSDDPGALCVQLAAGSHGLSVIVRDFGCGMEYESARDDGMGVGLAVISALAQRARFLTPADGGTEVRMWFAARSGARPAPPSPADLDGQPPPAVVGDVVVTVSPVSLMTAVLGRLARALAASAHFSFDRFADVYLVADTIGAHAQSAVTGESVSFALRSGGKRLELAAGPFARGSGAEFKRFAHIEAHDSPLGVLADEVAVDNSGPAETLHVLLRDRAS